MNQVFRLRYLHAISLPGKTSGIYMALLLYGSGTVQEFHLIPCEIIPGGKPPNP